MARTVIIILSTILLSACSIFGKEVRPTEVILTCPAPPNIERPELDVLYLKETDTPDIVIQSHRSTIRKLQKWGLQQEAILDGYRGAK